MEVDWAIRREVDDAVLAGEKTLALDPYAQPFSREVDVSVPVQLAQHAVHEWGKPTTSDAWFGPRLHSSLRLTRREAAHSGIWRWLALGPCASYVRWRWESRDPTRFLGRADLHALARLWWMSELFRDGQDYAPAEKALAVQDVAQNLLRMNVAHHRPLCQGFLMVESRAMKGGQLNGREVNALAKAANCAATTIDYAAYAPDVALDADARAAWIAEEVDFEDVLTKPIGPDDPAVPIESVDSMRGLLADLFVEAPVRGERVGSDDEPEA
jgi:hypothetical protein